MKRTKSEAGMDKVSPRKKQKLSEDEIKSELEEPMEEIWADNDYRASIIYALRRKPNLDLKLKNKTIVAKWREEAIAQGADEYDFDDTINILSSMMKSRKLRAKRKRNQYYSDDEDSVSSNEHADRMSNVINRTEEEMDLTDLGKRLREYVDEQLESKLDEKSKDWHPGSNQQVLDLVHPSLYCYIDGESVLIETKIDDQIREFLDQKSMDRSRSDDNYYGGWHGRNERKSIKNDEIRFQWIPSEFEVNQDGTAMIKSYINNLDRLQHDELYDIIGGVFGKIAPLFEEVLNTSFRSGIDDIGNDTNSKRMQVIVKMANIVIEGEEEYGGGVWHVEGMEYEHIVASAIYYYDVKNIKGSYLQFREEGQSEGGYEIPQNDDAVAWDNHHKERGDPSCIYRGKLAIDQEKVIVFTNNWQHRVTKHKLRNTEEEGRRKILVFFLVDPNQRIVSSEMVPFQQKEIMATFLKDILLREQKEMYFENLEQMITEYLPCFGLKEAKQNREKLMFVRKYVQKEDNKYFERPFSFCEH